MFFDPRGAKANLALLFAAGLALATGFTFWFGFQATREWQRSTSTAAETRGNEVVTLLAVAFERDMKGAQNSVLLPLNEEIVNTAPYDLGDRFARGFARFPYLESFFVWTAGRGEEGSTYVFNRADRTPPWDASEAADDPYPVVFRRNPAPLQDVVRFAQSQAHRGSRFALFELTVDNVPYQVVANLMYDGTAANARLQAVAGFMVNLAWVREHYFGDFVRQIQGIIGDTSLSIAIVNDKDETVAAVGPPVSEATPHERRFPLLFADTALLPGLPRQHAEWTARVSVASEASRAAATRSAVRTLALLGLGAGATLIGLVITVRAARRSAALAAVQAEFVSAVSHEMKTPLSLIKLASDTLANGRYADASAIADYGRLMGTEAQHLTRLIDNVLCYARITDSTSKYDFEQIDIAELVQESVDRFRPQLTKLGFKLQVQLPVEPVFVNGDHPMLSQVFDNLIDNAAKHAEEGHFLAVTVAPSDHSVSVTLTDRGSGIPAADLPRVFDKFYRRKGARQRGSGLGLTIVHRIVDDHHGTVRMESVPKRGTTVTVTLATVGGQ